MGKKIHSVNGMPVELTMLDPKGELERERLNALALEEYGDTGSLSSDRLVKANELFLSEAKKHVLNSDDYV